MSTTAFLDRASATDQPATVVPIAQRAVGAPPGAVPGFPRAGPGRRILESPSPEHPEAAPATDADLVALLDETQRRLTAGDVFETMENLNLSLGRLRAAAGGGADGGAWAGHARDLYLHHTLRSLLTHEPVTRHSAERPRGYAGDAALLDYIYGAVPLPPGTTDLGRRLHEWGFQAPAQKSVRARRDLLSRHVDEVADRTGGGAEILSVACGHLREAAQSQAVRRQYFRRYVGLDQDAESLALARRELGHAGVDLVQDSICRLAFGRLDLGPFDLVYAAGLYDYLPDALATRLTTALFAMLKPHGRLLVANFVPGLRDIAYMEVVMDWHLTYREAPHMVLLSAGLPTSHVATQRLFFDAERNIIFLEVEKE